MQRFLIRKMTRCDSCKNYTALIKPRKVEVGWECYIYGFCFKDYRGTYGSAYPVYIPDSGVCKSYEKIKGYVEPVTGQISIAEFLE